MLKDAFNGQYGGRLLALFSSFLVVVMESMVRNLISLGVTSKQVVFMRMSLTIPPILIMIALSQREVFTQLNPFHIKFGTNKSPADADADSEHQALLDASDQPDHHHNPRRARLIWARSVLCGVGLIIAYTAFAFGDLSDLVAIFNLRIFPVAILCWVVLGEKMGTRMIIAACISTACVMCIVQPAFLFPSTAQTTNPHRYLGYVLALTATSLGAIEFVLMRKIGRDIRVMTAFLPFTSVAAIFSGIALLAEGFKLERLADPSIWLQMVALTAISFLSQCTTIMALQRETAPRVTMISYSQIVFALVIQISWFGVIPSTIKILAMLVIIFVGIWPILAENGGEPVRVTTKQRPRQTA